MSLMRTVIAAVLFIFAVTGSALAQEEDNEGLDGAIRRGDCAGYYRYELYKSQESFDPEDFRARTENDAAFFIKCAHAGYARAYAKAGEVYDNGEQVPQSYSEAMYWFKKSVAALGAKSDVLVFIWIGNHYSEGAWRSEGPRACSYVVQSRP
jgi:TPR repeat protein